MRQGACSRSWRDGPGAERRGTGARCGQAPLVAPRVAPAACPALLGADQQSCSQPTRLLVSAYQSMLCRPAGLIR